MQVRKLFTCLFTLYKHGLSIRFSTSCNPCSVGNVVAIASLVLVSRLMATTKVPTREILCYNPLLCSFSVAARAAAVAGHGWRRGASRARGGAARAARRRAGWRRSAAPPSRCWPPGYTSWALSYPSSRGSTTLRAPRHLLRG